MEDGPFDPRQRVVGAVILVVLAVVILPMILRRPPSRMVGQDVLTIRRSGDVLSTDWSKVAKAAPQSTGKGAAVSTLAKPIPAGGTQPPVAAALPAQRPRHFIPAAQSHVRPTQTAHPKSMPIETTNPSSGWYVQVGAYVNTVDAITFGRTLRAQGFPVHVRLARLPSGRGLVVVVGPYSRIRAQRAKKAVARRDKIQGILIHTVMRAK